MGVANGFPFVAAFVWDVFIAPKAVLSPGTVRGLLQIVIFGVPATALTGLGHPPVAAVFILVVIANAALMRVWDQ